jgi:hypothetical protein
LPSSGLIDIILTRQIRGREEFHKRLFEVLLNGTWQQRDCLLQSHDKSALFDVLKRWVTEAPVNDEFGVSRVLAVRSAMRGLLRAAGTSVKEFLLNSLSLKESELQNPQMLPVWKQSKLSALGDATILSVEALKVWFEKNPELARLAAITSMDACPLDAIASEATGRVGNWLTQLEPGKLNTRYLIHLQNSAFHVSYLADPARHYFKNAIVRQAAYMLKDLKLPTLTQRQSKDQQLPKIRITLIAELLFPQHAMFRCYAEALSSLKAQFHVLLVADELTKCDEHALVSHAQIYFPPSERDVVRLADIVNTTRPDIILFPSIGMSYWTFALSLLRLAPLQLMSVGHPAPSFSGNIDGTLLYQGLATSELSHFGRIITYDEQSLPKTLPFNQYPGNKIDINRLVISVNASRMKLTPDFLAMVKEVILSAPDGTDLHFFPNAIGSELLMLRSELCEWFPEAVVHPSTDYDTYMNALSNSDLVLQSFPFGGTNTTIDALKLGIPLICLQNDDLSGAVDPLMLKRAGLELLCASSKEEYVNIAKRLLCSHVERAEIIEKAKSGIARLEDHKTISMKSMADAVKQTWDEFTMSRLQM